MSPARARRLARSCAATAGVLITAAAVASNHLTVAVVFTALAYIGFITAWCVHPTHYAEQFTTSTWGRSS